MAFAFVQQKSNSSGSTGQFAVVTGSYGSNITAGNMLWWVVNYSAATAQTITWADTQTSTFTEVGNFHDGVGYGVRWGYCKNITGGPETITATFLGAVDFPAIYTAEYSGFDTTAPFTTGETASNEQTNPGTGAGAVTSGNSPSLSAQPAGVIGFSFNANGTVLPSAANGTSRTQVWNFANNGDSGGTLTARPEDRRVTATTAVASTFTIASGTDKYFTLEAVFKETGAGGASPFVAGEMPNPRRALTTIAPLIAGSLLLTTFGPNPKPFTQTQWPNPIVKTRSQDGFASSFRLPSQTPNVKPVGTAQFPTSFPPKPFMVSEHAERTAVGQAPAGPQPFTQGDWPNPRGARPVTTGVTSAFLLNTQPVQLKPLGQASFPNPILRSTGSVSEHFNRTDTGTPPPVLTFPFSQTDWTNPRGKASFKTPVVFRLDPDVAPGVPFYQSDFPNPILRKPQALTWTQGLLPVLAPANIQPFNQTDFPNPRGYTPNIVLKTGNDTRTILLPVGPQPFGQSDWPVPKGYNPVVSLKTLTDSSLLFQPPNIQPFGQSDWQNPRGPVPAIALKDGNYSVTITLPPGPIPPPPVIADSSTPGRLKRHDWWKTKDQVEKEQKKPAPKIEKIETVEEEVTPETVKVALERTRATVKALGAQVNEEGVKRPRKEAVALEKQLLEAQQQELLLATQQAVLLEEQEISDIAYIAMMVMQQEE